MTPTQGDGMAHPVNFELDAPEEVANWRPLVHWVLVLPHAVIAGLLGNVGALLAVVSWFVVVFTGRLPQSIADVQCLVLRYQARANSYALFLREPYPPFEFDTTPMDPRTDPVRVDVAPQLEDRDRLTVGLRLFWIIPIALFAALVGIVAWAAAVVGFFAVLVTGRWPAGVRDFVVRVMRLYLRVNAYAYLLVDEYPPFELE